MADSNEINQGLVKIFNDVLQIEENEIKRSQFSDLTIKEMHTIEAIGMYVRKTNSEVAAELNVTPGTLSVSINNLVRKNYVERIRSVDDRRVVHLALTRRGRLLFRVHRAFHKKMVDSFIVGLDDDQLAVVSMALKNLDGFLEDQKKH